MKRAILPLLLLVACDPPKPPPGKDAPCSEQASHSLRHCYASEVACTTLVHMTFSECMAERHGVTPPPPVIVQPEREQ